MSDKPDLDNVPMHMPEGDLAPQEESHGGRLVTGPVIILLVLLLALILGGMYWWYITKLQNESVSPTSTRPTAAENNEPESTTAEAQVDTLGTMSPSDELSAIEADLEGTNLDSLDSELTAIESELENNASE